MSKTILITGCSSGIGRHCALQLRERGWRVFATARKEEDLQAIEAAGLDALYLDYREPDSIAKAFAAVMAATGGRLDALFNNGAFGQPGAVEDLPTDVLREQFEANFFGWHTLSRLAVKAMREQGYGRIIHCSSVLGIIPYRWRGAYIASKYALEGLAATQRLELSGSGIHVVVIQPGPIRTKFGESAIRHFLDAIDIDGSVHAETYRHHLQAIRASSQPARFRLEPEAVFAKLLHALDARRPRNYYRVTVPTHFMEIMRRLLPSGLLDIILKRSD